MSVSSALTVAVQLTDGGHHPGARTRTDTHRPRTDYWIELAGSARSPLDLAADPPHVVRIRADDLREAQRLRAAEPESLTALLDVEVLIAPTAAQARARLAELDAQLPQPHSPRSVRYVGTPSGLAGLLADIRAAGVADGVTLLPLELPRTLDLVADEVLDILSARGLAVPAHSREDVLARFGSVAPATAS